MTMDIRMDRRRLASAAAMLGMAAAFSQTMPGLAQTADGAFAYGPWDVTILPPAAKPDTVLEITQSAPFWSGLQLKSGETSADNIVTRWIEQQLGVRYNYAWEFTDPAAVTQKWSLALASGDLPEFLSCVPVEIYSRLSGADRLEDITDIWEATASPLTKEKLEYPDNAIWQNVMKDGRLYGTAFANSIGANDMVGWIRQDWLDKVGMAIPTTFDELEAVGKAFMDAGLAKMGLAVAMELVTYLGSLDPIFGAYGVMPTFWLKGDNNDLVYGSIQPGVKDALAYIQQLHADGFIDKEFFTIGAGGSNGVGSLIVSGQAGIIFGPHWVASYMPASIKENDPEANLTYFALPTGPNGVAGRAATAALYGLTAFTKGTDPAKIEAVINHLNWIYERFDQQLDTHDYFNQGVRYLFDEYDFALEGDDVRAGDYPTWALEGGAGDPVWRYPRNLADWGEKLVAIQAKDEASRNAMERFLVADPSVLLDAASYKVVVDTADIAFINEFTGTATETMVESGADLRTLEVETFTKIIAGQLPLDAFDTFIEEWKKQGGDQLTSEVNEWYSSR